MWDGSDGVDVAVAVDDIMRRVGCMVWRGKRRMR